MREGTHGSWAPDNDSDAHRKVQEPKFRNLRLWRDHWLKTAPMATRGERGPISFKFKPLWQASQNNAPVRHTPSSWFLALRSEEAWRWQEKGDEAQTPWLRAIEACRSLASQEWWCSWFVAYSLSINSTKDASLTDASQIVEPTARQLRIFTRQNREKCLKTKWYEGQDCDSVVPWRISKSDGGRYGDLGRLRGRAKSKGTLWDNIPYPGKDRTAGRLFRVLTSCEQLAVAIYPAEIAHTARPFLFQSSPMHLIDFLS